MPFFLSLYAIAPCSQPMLSAKALSFTSRPSPSRPGWCCPDWNRRAAPPPRRRPPPASYNCAAL